MALSQEFADLHDELVAEFGEGEVATWAFDVLGEPSGATGVVPILESRTASTPSIYPIPPSGKQLQGFVDGVTVLQTDRVLTVAGDSLDSSGASFRPAAGMEVQVAGESYVAVSAVPIGMGERVVFYVVFVRGR